MEGEHRAQVAFRTEALEIPQVLRCPCYPPTPPGYPLFPQPFMEPVPARLVVLWALGLAVAVSKVWLVGGRGVGCPEEPWAPSLGGLVYASACLVPWLLVPVAYM